MKNNRELKKDDPSLIQMPKKFTRFLGVRRDVDGSRKCMTRNNVSAAAAS